MNPFRVLVTGASGMLGRDLVRTFQSDGWSVDAATHADLDITDAAACRERVAHADLVINAAAYTAVDAAESHEEEAFATNAWGAGTIASAAERAGARLVHISTDYVFDGTRNDPYPESAALSPIQAYGRSKAEGERQVLAAHPEGTIILRSAWLYGAQGSNFVRTMHDLYREHGRLTVVDDQHGQPTWTADVARQTAALVTAGVERGVLHATNSGSTTWFGFARAIIENLGGDPDQVIPIDTASFPRPARRPANSVLDQDGWRALGLEPMRPWREALDEFMTTHPLA